MLKTVLNWIWQMSSVAPFSSEIWSSMGKLLPGRGGGEGRHQGRGSCRGLPQVPPHRPESWDLLGEVDDLLDHEGAEVSKVGQHGEDIGQYVLIQAVRLQGWCPCGRDARLRWALRPWAGNIEAYGGLQQRQLGR